MLVHYATKANSQFYVYLPSQYGYPNEGNFSFDRLHERKKITPVVSLNLTDVMDIDIFYGFAN